MIKYKKDYLLIFTGCGYSENEDSYHAKDSVDKYKYSVDMRRNYDNVKKNIIDKLGEENVDIALITNKHKYYKQFLEHYNAIEVDYDDVSSDERDELLYYLEKWTRIGRDKMRFGNTWLGSRFLKLNSDLPNYKYYIFLRSDIVLKKNILEMDINYDKINLLWPETDLSFFLRNSDNEVLSNRWNKIWEHQFEFWDSEKRSNGNILNIVPFKFIRAFMSYYYTEHMIIDSMVNDLGPLVKISDFHFICGKHWCYDGTITGKNPIYKFTKTIL